METGFIRVGEVANLATKLGIDTKFMKIGTASLESEKYVCVRDEDGTGAGQLTIVEMEKGMALNRKPNASEAAIMHTQENIIALKAPGENGLGHIIQVYNFDTKAKLKTCVFKDKVVYWRWVSAAKLAVVTSSSLYFIDITNESTEQKVLERFGALA